jgi:hypothetical protein
LPVVDFTQSCIPHEAIGQSPFRTVLAYDPRMSFDWKEIKPEASARERLNREEAQAWTKHIQEAWEFARGDMARAQERYTAQANKHRRPVDFAVKDKVWVTTKNWDMKRPSRKLAQQMAGPYEILEKIGHSYRLKLPQSIKVHPVFSPDKLRRAPEDPLPGQKNPPLDPIEVDGDLEWEIDRVLSVRLVRKRLMYKVQWKGHDTDPDEYPASNLWNAPKALQDFHIAYPKLPGPPKNLKYWLECAENDVFPKKRAGDNSPA